MIGQKDTSSVCNFRTIDGDLPIALWGCCDQFAQDKFLSAPRAKDSVRQSTITCLNGGGRQIIRTLSKLQIIIYNTHTENFLVI